ncbi:MAG: inorganic pyrophosphatase, partial [Lachnospiraceae bacterium]|nr:inorganic pyrophosphatase [Lachnospiraceae bacterium]
ELMEYLETLRQEKEYELALLMITDILKEGSLIYCAGSGEDIRQAFNVSGQGDCFFLPGIISRKKQIIPALSAIWG